MNTTAADKTGTSSIKVVLLFPKLYRLVCCYCGGKAARGGNDVEGAYSHIKCHLDACR